MAELYGLDIGLHLESILSEYESKKTIYGYPERKFFRGWEGFDFSVDFHDQKAATHLGPASGPHSQMVQNIILAFLGGGRIMELKTVQILDELEIPRPCIDARNVGYNVEWSQEMKLEDSFQEYLGAWVLLKIIEEMEILKVPKGSPFYNTVFDVSVGYDLKGISSEPVHKWLQDIQNAGPHIERILDTLPLKYAHLKNLDIPTEISHTTTLSTFHGCPRDEIEAIVKHLISEHHFHVIVKMNPTIMGYEWVRETLNDKLGYKHIELDPEAFDHDISFDDAVAMMKRLVEFGRKHDRRVGAKFTNTLVVKNTKKDFFANDEVQYLSGQPLHVISMNSMHHFRRAMGDDFHISFSAGVDKRNFVDATLCNMRPVTTCTDLLRVGGYTRLYSYMENLKKAMEKADCTRLEDFIISQAEGADTLARAGVVNSERIVPQLVEDPRYGYGKNHKVPRRIDSHLELFDCITCNKCIPVCPNAANFSIPVGPLELDIVHYRYENGQFIPQLGEVFQLEKPAQIANLADFCNECGNCDTFCPEYGGPYIEKPRFFFDETSYTTHSTHDGFYFPTPHTLKGRIKEVEYILELVEDKGVYRWTSPEAEMTIDRDHKLQEGKPRGELKDGTDIDMNPYYACRIILDGLLSSTDDFATILLRGLSTT